MRRTERLLVFLLCLPHLAFCDSESLVLLDVGAPADQAASRLLNADTTHFVNIRGMACLNLEEIRDPYQKSEWLFRFDHNLPADWKKLVLEVVYVDEGPGVIQPELLANDSHRGRWSKPTRAVSFTRLNTGVERKALFEFDLARLDWVESSNPHLKIAGLQHLRSIRAFGQASESTWRELADSVPKKLAPIVRLERPMEITCTVGIEDVGDPPSLENSLNSIREYAPLAKLLGFTSIECFVRWDMIEPQPGVFDFSHYDQIAQAIESQGLKWFPNLVITSAFSMPQWYYESPENVGMVCLEHGELNQVPSIWNEANRKHVTRVLAAFGDHYEPMGVLEAVRLGPSGNFGEAQYPAGAGSALGYKSKPMHAHIGWWCGDALAKSAFQSFLQQRYPSIQKLNEAWDEGYASFDEIQPQLPEGYRTRQGRFDMTSWYSDSMSEWCDFWAQESRKAMPNTKIYQSSGGWGFREAGTDFSAQAQSMQKISGGIRLTNETDSFEQNFYATRLAATAAKVYGLPLGYEPAGYHSARGVVGRMFSTATTNGSNLYTRHSVLFTDPFSVENWLRDYSLLDQRANAIVDVAVYYPETMSQLDDGAFRHLYGWGFNPRAAEIRRRVDLDFLDERLIRDGFLDRYKVLVFCWGNIIDADVLQKIDAWIRAGGVAIFPTFPRGDYQSVEGDAEIFKNWERGGVGEGKFFRFKSDMEPISLYGDYVETVLNSLDQLHPWTKAMLTAQRDDLVHLSTLETGLLLALNYSDHPSVVTLQSGETISLAPLSIGQLDLKKEQ